MRSAKGWSIDHPFTFTGDFNALQEDGRHVNTQPRQAISKEYIRSHGDTFDFLVFLSTFNYAMKDPAEKGFYLVIKRESW